MKFSKRRIVFLAILAVVSLSLSAWADTLEMKDGRLIRGKYLGGSEHNIRFLVNGKAEYFPVGDVLTLSFSETTTTPAVPNRTSSRSSSSTITVPEGTRLLVRMIDGVDTARNKVGDPFHASLAENLTVEGTVVASKDTDVYGRLAESQSAGQIKGRSELKLELTGISINGTLEAIVTSDYEVAGKSRGKQSAERIGGGAALGAIIGAIAGGGKGAAIGAAAGAGAGTAVQVLTKGQQVRVPSETLLEFTLAQPLTVELPRSASR